MKRILWGLALVFVTSAFAQQQPPTNSPPYTTPPTFPEGRPQQQMPPDTKAPPPQDQSASEVEQQVQDKLSREPALANTEIGVKVDATSVTLTGSVDTERQRDLALRIAQSYAGRRKIVDKIKTQGQA
jgi:BON domain